MQRELKETGLKNLRIVALSYPLANAKDLANWLGV